VPERLRASGIGWYSATVDVRLVAACAGWLWIEPDIPPFFSSAGFRNRRGIALLALVPRT